MSGINQTRESFVEKLNYIAPITEVFIKLDPSARTLPVMPENESRFIMRFLTTQISKKEIKSHGIKEEMINMPLPDLMANCLQLYFEEIISEYSQELAYSDQLRVELIKRLTTVLGAHENILYRLLRFLDDCIDSVSFKTMEEYIENNDIVSLTKMVNIYENSIELNKNNKSYKSYAYLAIKICQINSGVYSITDLDCWDMLFTYQSIIKNINRANYYTRKIFSNIKLLVEKKIGKVFTEIQIHLMIRYILTNFKLDSIKTEFFEEKTSINGDLSAAAQRLLNNFSIEQQKLMTHVYGVKRVSENIKLRENISQVRLINQMSIMINVLDYYNPDEVDILIELLGKLSVAYDKRYRFFDLSDHEKNSLYFGVLKTLKFLSLEDLTCNTKKHLGDVMLVFAEKMLHAIPHTTQDNIRLVNMYNAIQKLRDHKHNDSVVIVSLENMTRKIALYTDINRLQNIHRTDEYQSHTSGLDPLQPIHYNVKRKDKSLS